MEAARGAFGVTPTVDAEQYVVYKKCGDVRVLCTFHGIDSEYMRPISCKETGSELQRRAACLRC